MLLIDKSLANIVTGALGAEGKADKIIPAKTPVELEPSPALRLNGKFKPTLAGRKVGLLLGAGFDARIKKDLVSQIENEGDAKTAIVTTKIQGGLDSQWQLHPADMSLRASPSVLFDAVVILAGAEGDKKLASDPNAINFLMDAKRHCKAVGFSSIPSLSKKAGLELEPGVVDITGQAGVKSFIAVGRAGRFWEREAEQ